MLKSKLTFKAVRKKKNVNNRKNKRTRWYYNKEFFSFYKDNIFVFTFCVKQQKPYTIKS
jgi:hypothetical protein